MIGGIKAWLKKVSYGHPMSSLNIEEVTTVEQQDRGHEVPITPGGKKEKSQVALTHLGMRFQPPVELAVANTK